jgi:hypothetical protein
VTIEFVGIGPVAYVASGESRITIERPDDVAVGDVMLVVTFARLGRPANTDPPDPLYFQQYLVMADDGTPWSSRAATQHLLYRPVEADEPASYTFEFTNEQPSFNPPYVGPVEDYYIVGVIVAYRGAETADPVGSLEGEGEPIVLLDEEWDPGLQLSADFWGAGGDEPPSTSWNGGYWYARVEGSWSVFVVVVDWGTGPIGEAEPQFAWPDEPTNVTVDFPSGFTVRTPPGSFVVIADGPSSEEIHPTANTFIGSGTWRGHDFEVWDIGVAGTLTCAQLATPEVVIAGRTFSLDASSHYLSIFPPERRTRYFIATWARGSARGVAQHRGGEGVLHRRES